MRVFDLPVHVASAWIFNCYLLADGDTPVVAVDAGLPMVADRAVGVLSELGREPGAVASVLATHGHSDHVGGIARLRERSGASALLPERCRSYLDGEAPRRFPLLKSSVRFMPVWREQRFEMGALREFASTGRSVGYGSSDTMRVDFPVDGYLADGDQVPGAPGWEVVHAPGHTDDATCYYHRDSATLLSGDTVVTHDGRAWFNPEHVEVALSRRTEERLRALEVRHLLPGHGHPIEAADVWATARHCEQPPDGRSVLERCSRRFGRWVEPTA